MTRITQAGDLDALDFTRQGGMVTVVAQEARTRAVLMVAFADREALERSLETGQMHYRSRTRGAWRKGETSGNVQRVAALYADCDGDAVLALVEQAGPACHTGKPTCFGDPSGERLDDALGELDAIVRERDTSLRTGADRPASYTQRLLADRNLRLKKLGEEVAELVLACADGSRERAVLEAADVFYHVLVALRALGAGLDEVRGALRERRR